MTALLPTIYQKTVKTPHHSQTPHENKISNHIKLHYNEVKKLQPSIFLFYDAAMKYFNNEYEKLPYKFKDPNISKSFFHLNNFSDYEYFLKNKSPISKSNKKYFKCPFLVKEHAKNCTNISQEMYIRHQNVGRKITIGTCDLHASHTHCPFCVKIFQSNGNRLGKIYILFFLKKKKIY